MDPIKLIFTATGNVAVNLLKSLHHDSRFEILLVVTGTDKPMGRKMELQPNLIKKTALELGLKVFQPENIKSPEAIEQLKSADPDLMLVMAYGQILSQEVLDVPTINSLNVHASLLPKYRGASPIQSAILNGEPKTGITLMKMVKQMDAGAMYQHFEIPITNDTTASLEEKLANLAAEKIPDTLVKVAEGKLTPIEQNEAEATYVTKISKADGQIDWNEPAEVIERKIRAFNPWPSTYTFFKRKRLKILSASVLYKRSIHHVAVDDDAGWAGKGEPPTQRNLTSFELDEEDLGEPGQVVEKNGKVGVATGKGLLLLSEVQLEGKKPQTMKEFLNGNGEFIGANLAS